MSVATNQDEATERKDVHQLMKKKKKNEEPLSFEKAQRTFLRRLKSMKQPSSDDYSFVVEMAKNLNIEGQLIGELRVFRNKMESVRNAKEDLDDVEKEAKGQWETVQTLADTMTKGQLDIVDEAEKQERKNVDEMTPSELVTEFLLNSARITGQAAFLGLGNEAENPFEKEKHQHAKLCAEQWIQGFSQAQECYDLGFLGDAFPDHLDQTNKYLLEAFQMGKSTIKDDTLEVSKTSTPTPITEQKEPEQPEPQATPVDLDENWKFGASTWDWKNIVWKSQADTIDQLGQLLQVNKLPEESFLYSVVPWDVYLFAQDNEFNLSLFDSLLIDHILTCFLVKHNNIELNEDDFIFVSDLIDERQKRLADGCASDFLDQQGWNHITNYYSNLDCHEYAKGIRPAFSILAGAVSRPFPGMTLGGLAKAVEFLNKGIKLTNPQKDLRLKLATDLKEVIRASHVPEDSTSDEYKLFVKAVTQCDEVLREGRKA